jgi:hypothetical protein
MATALTPTTGSNLLKQLYSPKVVESTIAKGGSPFFGSISHDRDGEGSLYVQPTIDSDAPSGSADFPTAQDSGNVSTLSNNQFQVPYKPIYTTFSVANTAIVQSMGQKGSWGPLLKRASDSGLRMNAHVMSNLLVGTGFGEIGVIDASTNLGAAVITLKDAGTAGRFMKNMKLVLATQAANGALRNAGAIGYVQSVDYVAGTVTPAATPGAASGTNISTIWPAAATGDFICMAGCTDGTGTIKVPVGFPGWIPPDNNRPASNDAFFNVNRSTNPLFLAGYAANATSGAFQDNIQDAIQFLISYTGAKNIRVGMNPKRWAAIAKVQQGQLRYVDVKGRGDMLFKSLNISVEGHEADLYADRYLGLEQCFGYDPSAVIYKSVQGQLGTFMDQGDGMILVRQASDPGVEGRIWSHGAFVVADPSKCANIRFAVT